MLDATNHTVFRDSKIGGTVDVSDVREHFPILFRKVHGRRLAYLDNASTTQKPGSVMKAVLEHYRDACSNVHRGVHFLSQEATEQYETAREKARKFINAAEAREIVFVRGATEAINLVARSYGRAGLHAGDEILISGMEHHSNIVPWQMLRDEIGIVLRVVPLSDNGSIAPGLFSEMLNERTRLVSFTHISNALGTVNPVKQIVSMAHRMNVPVLVDGAQAAGHRRIDVQDIGCDFYAFSGHKMYGPTGIGILYGRRELLSDMPPYQGGGEMIRSVSFDRTEYADIPHRFEAGTPDIAGVAGLGAAIDYIDNLGMETIEAHEERLLRYATERLESVPGLRFIGDARHRSGILSFVLDGIHPHDAGTVLDSEGVAVRAGHHCAQPVMERFGVAATLRMSLGVYNNRDDIDQLVDGLATVREVLG